MHGGLAIVILAAGASTRFGSPKQLAPLQDEVMLRTIAQRAVEIGPGRVTVVLGAHAQEIRPLLDDMPVEVVVNEAWREGLGSSLRAGIESLPDHTAALVWLGDQAGVTVEDLSHLIDAWDRDRSCIAASSYRGTVGVPAIFPNSVFTELLGLRGDHGAKGVLLRQPDRTTLVEMPNAAIDIDTPADLKKLSVPVD
jgi:molybdenum cofactor cytidylyltransferase